MIIPYAHVFMCMSFNVFSLVLDVLFQNQAPVWYKAEVSGPAPGPYKRKPGCNGGVCYCNKEDYCNAIYEEITNDSTPVHLDRVIMPVALVVLRLYFKSYEVILNILR